MSDSSIRVCFWNTWLLRPRLWPGGPAVPGGDRFFAPQVTERAPLVGEAVRERFDVVALAECFERPEQEAVSAAWPGADLATGPQRSVLRFTGSGLATLIDPARATLIHSETHAFHAGGDLRDADTFAAKGALLTRIELPGGAQLDIVSTHLLAGGEFLPIPGHADAARHHDARMGQVDELMAFVEEIRVPSNPVLLVGDLNVRAHDPDPALAKPTHRYQDLSVRLRRVGFTDLWADNGTGPGHTCTFTEAADLPPDAAEPDQVFDDPKADPATAPGERIDYLWLAPATDGHLQVEADRPRRWAFPGRAVRGGPAGSLSDHLALSVTLRLSASS